MAFAIALLAVTFLHVTFGEMVPKNISVSVADKAALLLAPPLMFIARAGQAGHRGAELVREPHPEADADRAEGRG